MISAQDIAWAAGVYEGEGSVQIPSKRQRTVNVQVTQKDPWLCYRLQELFGGRVRENRNYKVWVISGPKARGFLMTIFLFLSPRRKERIKEALAPRTDYERGPYQINWEGKRVRKAVVQDGL